MSTSDYPCSDYLSSRLAREGLWDEQAQLWLILPLAEVEELALAAGRFLAVGRAGVDGIVFGYRQAHPGFWAYHPIREECVWLAPDLSSFVAGWTSGVIVV